MHIFKLKLKSMIDYFILKLGYVIELFKDLQLQIIPSKITENKIKYIYN